MSVSRIMIIGGPGSGKTWLAAQVSRRLDLPVYAVDDAVWDPGGGLRPAAAIDARVRAQVSKQRWIIEGGNTRTYEERALRSDLIVRLNPPRWLRFIRVMRRDGLKFSLLLWTLKYDAVFAAKDRAALYLAKHTARCVELTSNAECEAFLEGLSAE